MHFPHQGSLSNLSPTRRLGGQAVKDSLRLMSVPLERRGAWSITINGHLGDTSMPCTFEGLWWSVELPDRWSGQQDKECVTFCARPPIGALQISAARKEKGIVSDEELNEFADNEVAGSQSLTKVKFGKFAGRRVEYSAAGVSWTKYWLVSGPLLLYVTYNVDEEKKGLERREVEEILGSLKPHI